MTLLAVKPILPEPERLIEIGIRVGISLVVALVALRVLFLLVGRAERWVVRVGGGSPHAVQRAKTIGQILRSMCSMLVSVAVSIHVLALLGWDVKPLLGAAGIVGVALGFGAQTLVRDLISGLFIIAEDQFSVGDLVEVNGKAATVEALSHARDT